MAEEYKKISDLTEILASDINSSTKMVVTTGELKGSKNLNVSDLVVGNLSTDSNYRALSSGMGKKLNDEKAPLKSPTFTGAALFAGTKAQFNCPVVLENNVSVVGDLFGENEIGASNVLANDMLEFGPDAVVKILTGVSGGLPVYREFPATELSSSDLNGSNYVMVYGTGTPSENAAELQAACNEAKTMPRYLGDIPISFASTTFYKGQTFYNSDTLEYRKLFAKVTTTSSLVLDDNSNEITGTEAETEAKSTRTTVIIAPGEYKFGAAAFVVDTPFINVVSLTGCSDVIISSTEEDSDEGYIYGIKVTANNVLVKGIDCKTNSFYIANDLNNLICEYCTGGSHSFGHKSIASGTFNYCVGGSVSFGTDGTASGTFNHCIGGDYSFGGGGTSSGVFNYCTGGKDSFGAGGTLIGSLINCKLILGNFRAPTGAGKIYNCIDGNGALVNYPAIVPVAPYETYTALFTQNGIEVPTNILLENTLNDTIVWTKDAGMVGVYYGKYETPMTPIGNKIISPQSNIVGTLSNGGKILVMKEGAYTIRLESMDSVGDSTDGLLNNTFIEIRIYN